MLLNRLIASGTLSHLCCLGLCCTPPGGGVRREAVRCKMGIPASVGDWFDPALVVAVYGYVDLAFDPAFRLVTVCTQ